MPLFLSDEEYERCSHDASLLTKKADDFIRQLINQLESVKAEADAASITAEQTCSLLEQRHFTLASEHSDLQSRVAQLNASVDQHDSELAQLQALKQQIYIQSIEKDGEIQLLCTEASELHKSKRQLMELLEQKDVEITEKNLTIKSYLDKIVNLTENAASKEAKICDLECVVSRLEASQACISQEKDIVERHNSWLNDELKVKVDSLLELRKLRTELEVEMSAKLADAEKRCNESNSSLALKEDRVRELESKLSSLEQELLSSKDVAVDAEKQFCAEISTLTKLVELYKESSEERSKKAGELEGVIKALETRLYQVENDSKERLEKEVSTRKEVEKEAQLLKEKFDNCQNICEEDGQRLVPLSSFTTDQLVEPVEVSDTSEDQLMLTPCIPAGVSGTALAYSLLRDGWSLAKMYSKYQEAVDALRHERVGRKQSQSILERVLYEIEEKAVVIMEERAEHERMVEAYYSLSEKLEHALTEQTTLLRQIQEQKVDIRKHERDDTLAEKEIVDLQKQVAVLLKECRDLQLRAGFVSPDTGDAPIAGCPVLLDAALDCQQAIPEKLPPFKDITGLVEQNVQLRRLVRNLSEEAKNIETELKEKYEKELQKHNEDVASKVDRISARAEEQKHMIEQLHTSVTMYKKLYEEEQKSRLFSKPRQVATEERRNDNIDLQECSQGHSRKAQEKALERLKVVEEELGNTRNELITTRSERDKLAIEVQLAREKLDRSLNDFEHQRDEYNIVRARNVKFSQLIIDYQRKLRESSEELNSAKEVSRNLNIEISLLKQEKEILLSSEKRFSDEIRNLTERNHRVQASLDTLQSTLEVREGARCAERKKQEEYMKQIEIEWASAKKELHEERENARNLTLERGSGMANALKQVEELQKELSDALHAVAAAEARASVAEVRCSELVKMKTSNIGTNSDLHAANEELDKLREEAQVNKEHMLQYKSIAQANDAALKQLEVAHENLKAEAENVVKLLEAELLSLGAQFHELEAKCTLKAEEIASAVANKEEALATLSLKFANMREECSAKTSQFAVMETQLTAIKDDLENERQKSHVTQANYERQVIMQSETIQELRRTSQILSTLQEEASQLRKLSDSLKIENNELKSRLETEKSVLRVVINDADKKYNEENEQNKTLHSQLEALHIKLAEMDRHSTGVSGSTSLGLSDDADGLQDVLKYLRRSKEIAETELSLVKQEKLRLQSQLETALKSVEAAQASLNTEQANYKAFLFSAEEFNSLQLQVREISLLRESNLQLREENKHNFQECQKLRESLNMARVELQNLHRSLEERQNDVEACKKEIDKERKEKEDLEKRVDELERCRSSDLEDFSRVRATLEQMKVNFREKEAQLEEINILCTEKQDVLLHLEQDIFRSRMELSDRESRLNQNLQLEVSLKSDIERQKRITAQSKKKLENLSKEKEDLIKENHVLSKHLEDARQGKKIGGDAAGEQAMKEKEKEKDSRIQTLEKVVERLKEELKKEKEEHKSEKEKRLKTKKTISDSYENVAQERHKLLEELDKHKHGLKMLKDEFEKQNLGKESDSEVTTQSHFLSGAVLEDVASVYSQAVDNFELVAQLVAAQPSSSMAESSSAPMDISSTGHGTSAVALLSTLSPAPVSANVNPGTVEEKEKKFDMPRPTLEARRAGRKLVRPRISNPEDSQGDMDLSEQEGPESSAKPSSLNDADTRGNLTSSSEPSVRKRPSISSESEAQDLHVSGEHSADTAGPMLKKYKHMETPADVEEGQISEIDHEQSAANLEDTEILPLSEEQIEDVIDTASGSKKTCGDSGNDVTETAGKQEELTIEPSRKEEILDDKSHVSDETFSKLNDIITSSDTPMVQAEHDFQQTVTETGAEPEEGEIPDILQVEDGGSVSFNFVESPKTGDMQSTEHATGTESLTGVDEVPLSTEEMELGEIVFFQPLEDVVNNAKDIITDEIGESSVGPRDNFEQPSVDHTQVKTDDNIKEETPEEPIVHLDKSSTTGKSGISKQGESSSKVGNEEGKTDDNMKEEAPEEPIVHLDKSSTTSETAISKQGESSSNVGGTEEGKQTSSPRNQSSRTINLLQRARERASLRQAGMSSSLTTSRGRGRSPRGRGTRGRGRGQQEPGGKQG